MNRQVQIWYHRNTPKNTRSTREPRNHGRYSVHPARLARLNPASYMYLCGRIDGVSRKFNRMRRESGLVLVSVFNGMRGLWTDGTGFHVELLCVQYIRLCGGR